MIYCPFPLQSAEPDARLATLEGIVERVTYHADDSGYSVLRLQTQEQAEPVTVVGSFSNPNPGETLLLFGAWTRHPKFGPQFRADRYQVKQPATAFAVMPAVSRIYGINDRMSR